MVGLLMGALGTGLGQAAGAAADMAKGYIDDERKVDLQRQFADIELEKQNRLDEAKKSREYEYKLKETDPNGQLVSNALKNSNLEARQAAQNTIDKVSTPGYLGSITQEDTAKSAGERSVKGMAPGETASERDYRNAQTESTRAEIENKKEINRLKKIATDPNATPEQRKAAKDDLEIRAGKDQDNYGTYTLPDGTVRKYNKKTGEDVQDKAPDSGPKEGDVAKSKSGKDIVFRNGKWEYK